MKTVAGLLQAQDGTIMLDGQDITHMRPHRIVQAGICYVPQTENVFPSLTVEENLDMGAFIRRGDVRAKRPKCMHSFPTCTKNASSVPAISAAASDRWSPWPGPHARSLLLLDEPAGLSPMLVGVMLEKIVEINSTGVAILIVEQNARQRCKRLPWCIPAMGQNRYEDTGQALLAHPEIRAMFLGGR